MGLFNTAKKILRGEHLDWHNPLPPVLAPDEALVTCTHCGKIYVTDKSQVRVTNFCFSCM
jgi:hypothetical protein